MPKVTHVNKARKAYPGIKKGEPYYWWAFMVGGRGGPKIRSKTPPRRSQLTQSEYLSTLYDIQDGAEAARPEPDEIEGERDSIVSELTNLKDETEGKLENMPDGLKEGDSGQLLQTRIDSLDEAISTLEGLDVSFDEDDKEEDESIAEYRTRFMEEKWQEVNEALSSIEE